MHRILIVLIIIGWVVPINANAQPVWHKTDSLTYKHFNAGEWESVLKEANRSLAEGVDFYYLRVRAGKAAYELKKYRLAASHFSIAHQWNRSDEFVNYWYYNALLLTGNSDEASFLASSFNNDFLQRMQIKPRGKLHSISLESQLTRNSRFGELSNEGIISDGTYINYRSVMKQQAYIGIGVDHALGSKLNLYHGFSRLNIQRTERFQSSFPQLDHSEEPSTSQFNYFIQGRYLLGNGWSTNASLSLLWGMANSNWITFRNSPQPIITAYEYQISDQIATVGLTKDIWWIRPQVSASIGTINQWRQVQLSPQFTLYPLGNTHLYLTSGLTLHNDQSADESKYVFSQKIGVKTGPIWLIADGWLGPMQNFSTPDGFVVYNMPEKIKQMAGLTIYLPLFKHKLELMARYRVAQKEGQSYHYSNTTEYTTSTYWFTDNNILISLKWNL